MIDGIYQTDPSSFTERALLVAMVYNVKPGLIHHTLLARGGVPPNSDNMIPMKLKWYPLIEQARVLLIQV